MTSKAEGSGESAPTWGLLMDGESMPAGSGEVFERVSPAMGQVVGRFAKGASVEVDRAVQGLGTCLETKTVQLNPHGGTK
jgi:hypothetical protein